MNVEICRVATACCRYGCSAAVALRLGVGFFFASEEPPERFAGRMIKALKKLDYIRISR